MKIDLLKKLLPGFLPLFVFILADEIWGTTIGIIVAVAFGIAELIIIYIREKRIDKFVIADTLLLAALGGISLLLENDIFFKLKPAIIETIFCIIIGISAFSKKNLMIMMSQRYLKGIEITEQQKKHFTASLRVLFWIFTVHTFLIVYAAFFMSKEAWAFISGGLFYIVFGIYFLYELIQNRIKSKKLLADEWLPIVDEDGNVTGKASRTDCHQNKELLHPVVHVHIINKKNEFYLQKRPETKLIQPGKWDTSVGGHVCLGETIQKALEKETFEETGLKNLDYKFFTKYVWKSEVESELVFMFIASYDEPIIHKTSEIAEAKFWSITEIKKNLGKNIFTPNFELEFKKLSIS